MFQPSIHPSIPPSVHPSIPLFTHPPLHPPFHPINKDEEGQLGPLDTPSTDLLPLRPLVPHKSMR